ncbi:LbetaH domain-containing protein [Spirosoma gilvum]
MNNYAPIFDPVQTTPFPLKVKLKSHFWKLINVTLFRLFPARFKLYRISLLRLFGANLSKDVTIDSTARIDHPWNLTMKSLASLGENSWIYCLAPITIGEKSCIGKDAYLLTGSHDVDDINFSYVLKPIVINEGCWVATGAYILPGVILGKYTVVAAKSVVTKNTEDFSIVGGNPAKFLKRRIFKEKV